MYGVGSARKCISQPMQISDGIGTFTEKMYKECRYVILDFRHHFQNI